MSGDLLLWLWHHFLLDPGLSRLGGPKAYDLDIQWLFQQIDVQASSPRGYLSTPQMCFFFVCVWGISGSLLREDLKYVLSSMSLCVVLKGKSGSCEEKMYIQGHSRRLGGTVCMCVHVHVPVFHCSLRCCGVMHLDTKSSQMFVCFVAENPSVYQVLRGMLHFYG